MYLNKNHGIQHNDTKHKNKLKRTLSITTLTILVRVVMLSIIFATYQLCRVLQISTLCSVIMLNVVMLSVVAPFNYEDLKFRLV